MRTAPSFPRNSNPREGFAAALKSNRPFSQGHEELFRLASFEAKEVSMADAVAQTVLYAGLRLQVSLRKS